MRRIWQWIKDRLIGNVLWDAVKWLVPIIWSVVGGVVISALVWFVNVLRSQSDFLIVAATFFIGTTVMYLASRLYVRAVRVSGSTTPPFTPPLLSGLPTKEKYADLAIKVIKVTADPRVKPHEWGWESKVRIVLRNHTGASIELGAPEWAPEAGGVPLQPDISFGYSYQRPKRIDGWKADQWDREEFKTITLQPNEATRVWIGIDPWFLEDDIKRRIEAKRLGTLVIPVMVSDEKSKIARKIARKI